MSDTTTVDLASWLTAVWDERQRIYEYPPDFVEDSGSARGPGWGKIGGDTCEVCDSYQFSGYESVVEDAWYEHMEQYHQRGEVLARIAADRKILELHRGPHECRVFKTGTYPANWTGEEIAESGEWVYVSTEYFEDEPCPTKLVLASPCKGREGWQGSWDE